MHWNVFSLDHLCIETDDHGVHLGAFICWALIWNRASLVDIVCCWKYLILINKHSLPSPRCNFSLYSHTNQWGDPARSCSPQKLAFSLKTFYWLPVWFCWIEIDRRLKSDSSGPFLWFLKELYSMEDDEITAEHHPQNLHFNKSSTTYFLTSEESEKVVWQFKMFSFINQRGARVICSPVAQCPQKRHRSWTDICNQSRNESSRDT